MRVLILGGTQPAHELAGVLVARHWWVTTLLAQPGKTPAGQVRVGDLGGAAGIARFIVNEGIEYVIDASHPFDELSSIYAAEAARATATPFFVLSAAPWQPGPHDRWQLMSSVEQAAEITARNFHHILVDFWDYPEGLSAFSEDRDNLYVLRTEVTSPGRVVTGRTPSRFRIISSAVENTHTEKQIMRDNQIDAVVLRNTGDTRSEPTLDAARELAIPVLLIDRPIPPAATISVHSTAEICEALHA